MSELSKNRRACRWRIGALLPLGAALSGMAMAAEVMPKADAGEEILLKDVKVKAARDKKETSYKADTASTGSKIAMPIRDIPQSVSVVKKELIQSQNAFNLRDALKNVSGLTIAAGEGGRTGDSITLRGFSANPDQYLDGVKENGQYSRDTFFLERAEVLKGASSILFGRGTTGGVINQIFKKPTGQNRVIGDFTYGTYDFKRSSIDAETAYDDLAARLNLMWQDTDSFRDYNYNNRWGIAPSFRYRISPDTELSANLLHQEEDGVFDYGVPMYKGKPADVPINTYYGFPDNRMLDTDVNVGTVALSHRFNDEFSVRNTVRYGEYDRKYLTHLFGAVTDTGLTSTVARTQALRGNNQENLYNQTDFVLKKPLFGFDNTLMFGAEFGWENYDFKSKNSTGVPSISIFNPVLTPSVGAGLATDFSGTLATDRYTETRTYAGYLMDQFELTPEWKLLAGVRYDVFSASQDDRLNDANDFGRIDRQWNPRAGIVWQPTKAQSYYFSYGTSFNPSAEAYSLSEATNTLPPEKNRNFEIGAKYDLFDGRVSATAALFRLEKTNARTASPTNPDLTVLSGEQRTDGFELGLFGEILPRLDLSMTYAYLDAEVTKSNSTAVGTVSGQTKSLQGMIPVNVPQHSGVTWLSYHLTDAWEIGGGVFYASERHTDSVNEVTLPGYARLDAVLAYHQKHYDVQLNVFNLTDTVYYESGQTRSALPGVPVSGQLSVRLKF
jgi:catecholate siderophore receptor